ncbi:hypothetical protein B0H14DRAFT_3125759 [Mycena olivaceomarginata]|nr:hypothetical protein B0H14DRAFT_2598607 [Mycena olivaceomarginata]KAJ7868025.1 hypothetical protein B0H14DRAFT_2572518 [Mycena olivaceomarginata]KAJ7893691.1 hypothetical protein B0H14DRAFT_3125759 [Mycena olivaceomarginata]
MTRTGPPKSEHETWNYSAAVRLAGSKIGMLESLTQRDSQPLFVHSATKSLSFFSPSEIIAPQVSPVFSNLVVRVLFAGRVHSAIDGDEGAGWGRFVDGAEGMGLGWGRFVIGVCAAMSSSTSADSIG